MGRNVCLYGMGSKINLIRYFRQKKLRKFFCFEVNAYRPSVTEKKIFSHFGGFLIDSALVDEIEEVSIKDQTERYKSLLEQHNDLRVVILIHSLDAPNLFSAESQEKLAELMQVNQIQVIASVDNMKIATLWSPSTLCFT